jgi:hypothetical protein
MNVKILPVIRIIVFLFFVSLMGRNAFAQSDAVLVEKAVAKLEDMTSDIPNDIRRVTVYRLNYNENYLSEETVGYIVSRIEQTFREYSALTIISPPELKPTNELKIFGRDSTIQISNTKGRSLAESNSELLLETAQKYSLHALIEVSVQKKAIEGFIINIRMIRPESQEVVWVKTLISNQVFPKEDIDKGKLIFLNVGVETVTGESFKVDSTTTDAEQQILNFNASITFRQPIDNSVSSYFGIRGGFNIYKGTQDSLYNATLLNLGVVFQYGLGEENESINANRLLLTLDADVRFALTKYEGSIFTISPGLQFNFTESISVGLYARNIISGDELRQKDVDQSITFNRLSYGLQCVFRF